MSLAEDAEEPATSGFPNPLSLSRLPNPENTDFIDRLPWELLKKIMWDCTHVFNLQDLAEPDCTHRWDYLVSVYVAFNLYTILSKILIVICNGGIDQDCGEL